MDTTSIILISVGCVLGLLALIIIFGKVSASRKNLGEIKKRVAKTKQQPAQENNTPIEVDLNRPEKKKGAIVTSYNDFDEEDKKVLGFGSQEQVEMPNNEQPVEFKRKSFNEIMRAREQRIANSQIIQSQQPEQDEIDDDFEDFREQHSSFISYKTDPALIEQIKDMSPQMRKVLFSNIFNRIDRD